MVKITSVVSPAPSLLLQPDQRLDKRMKRAFLQRKTHRHVDGSNRRRKRVQHGKQQALIGQDNGDAAGITSLVSHQVIDNFPGAAGLAHLQWNSDGPDLPGMGGKVIELPWITSRYQPAFPDEQAGFLARIIGIICIGIPVTDGFAAIDE